jgi:membrane protein
MEIALSHRLHSAARVLLDTYAAFTRNDAWAISSHIALNALLALFPFLIFLTALASFLGTEETADTAVRLLFEALPDAVARPLSGEVRNVLTGQRRDLLTVGGVLAIWFSSNGVEALRVGLNRAYDAPESRHFLLLRLHSLGFVVFAAAGLLALAFLVVLGPAIWHVVLRALPELAAARPLIDILRYAVTGFVLLLALALAHLWLPAGRRNLREVLPGIAATLVLWLGAGMAFGYYLSQFATYASTYAGFASAMIALVFLYFIGAIFLAGGELNATLYARRLSARLRRGK